LNNNEPFSNGSTSLIKNLGIIGRDNRRDLFLDAFATTTTTTITNNNSSLALSF